jgi:hypothetical protein
LSFTTNFIFILYFLPEGPHFPSSDPILDLKCNSIKEVEIYACELYCFNVSKKLTVKVQGLISTVLISKVIVRITSKAGTTIWLVLVKI